MRLRNEDDMHGMGVDGESFAGRSPTQFYDFAYVPADHSVALNRGLMPEFDAVRGLENPTISASEPICRSNARIFDPAKQLQELAVDALGAEGLTEFSRKDQTSLKASTKRKAQEKAMAKAKPGDKGPPLVPSEQEGMEDDERDEVDVVAMKG